MAYVFTFSILRLSRQFFFCLRQHLDVFNDNYMRWQHRGEPVQWNFLPLHHRVALVSNATGPAAGRPMIANS